MGRRGSMVVVVAVLVVGSIGGYRWWSTGRSPCAAAPEIGRSEVADLTTGFYEPEDLADAVSETDPDQPQERAVRENNEEIGDRLLAPGPPLDRPVLAILDPARVQFTGGQNLLLTEADNLDLGTVAVHHGQDGRPLWTRVPEGAAAEARQVEESFVLLQTDDRGRLGVQVLDPATGEEVECVRVGEAGGASVTRHVLLPLGDTLVIGRPSTFDQPSSLIRMETALEPSGDERLLWERALGESTIAEMHGTEDVIAYGGVRRTTHDRTRGLVKRGNLESYHDDGRLEIHAVSATDGRPLWSYPGEPEPSQGEPLAVNTVTGVVDGVVVVTVDRRSPPDEDATDEDVDDIVVETTLIGLDAHTGEQVWSYELGTVGVNLELLHDVYLVDNVLITRDGADAERGDLVGVDAASGNELWRIPGERVLRTDHGAVAGTHLFLPGGIGESVNVIDAPTGALARPLDGLTTSSRLTSDGSRIGITILFGMREAFVVYEIAG